MVKAHFIDSVISQVLVVSGSHDHQTTSRDVPPKTGTWRIIPALGYVVNNHGDRFRPLTGVVPLVNGICWSLTPYNSWDDLPDLDDPPSL